MEDSKYNASYPYIRYTRDGTHFVFAPLGAISTELSSVSTSLTPAISAASFLYMYSASAGTWKRPITETDSSDAVAAGRQSVIALSTMMGYNGATFDRMRTTTPADAQSGTLGSLVSVVRLTGYNGATFDRIRSETPADGLSGSIGHLVALTRNQRFNGSTFDREQGNQNVSVLASAARTSTTTSSDQLNVNGRGLHLYFDVTSAPGGGQTLIVDIQALAFGTTYYSLFSSVAITGTGVYIFKLYPGLIPTSAVINDVLPRTWNVLVTHSAGGSWTYSATANTLV